MMRCTAERWEGGGGGEGGGRERQKMGRKMEIHKRMRRHEIDEDKKTILAEMFDASCFLCLLGIFALGLSSFRV